jgi:hypothetical protein
MLVVERAHCGTRLTARGATGILARAGASFAVER